MEKPDALRIKFQESGGGFGNPLMGRVFDSDQDLPEEKIPEFMKLVQHCKLHESESGQIEADKTESAPGPRRVPTDVSTFQISLETPDKAVTLVGDMVRANKKLQKLVSFIRDHSRKELLK